MVTPVSTHKYSRFKLGHRAHRHVARMMGQHVGKSLRRIGRTPTRGESGIADLRTAGKPRIARLLAQDALKLGHRKARAPLRVRQLVMLSAPVVVSRTHG